MKILIGIKKISKISFWKNLRMDLHYFGWGWVVKPRILCSRNLCIKQCNGTIEAIDCGIAVLFGIILEA